MFTKLRRYIENRKQDREYATLARKPFIELAGRYLPSDDSATIVDLGCGDAEFAERLALRLKHQGLYLLDGNAATVNNLKGKYQNVVLYRAPGRMPFEEGTVDFLHCSHMIEHLYHEDLYELMVEIDRVLKPGGIFVVSSPLMWLYFYDDLSHVKPYSPNVFIKYMLDGSKDQMSQCIVSSGYKVLECKYRMDRMPLHVGSGFSSEYLPIDVMIQSAKWVLNRMGMSFLVRTGYTLVLKKGI